MSESSPNGQLLKSILYPGYPIHYGLSTEESILRQLSLLNGQLHERLPMSAPQIAIKMPQVTVNSPSPTYQIPPQGIRELARGQDELNRGLGSISSGIQEGVGIQKDMYERLGTISRGIDEGVDVQWNMYGKLGSISNRASESLVVQKNMLGALDDQVTQGSLRIAQAEVANRHAHYAATLLESLNTQVGAQQMQRLALLGGIYGVRDAVQVLGIDLSGGINGMQRYQRENLQELRRMMPVLQKIESIGGQQLSVAHEQARTLFDINTGISAQRSQLESISDQLGSLNAIGARANQYLKSIANAGNFQIYTNLQIKKLLTEALRGPLSPARRKSRETWQMGEAARQSGHSIIALSKFGEGMDLNNDEPRNYFSAGLSALEIGKLNVAYDNFFNAYKLSEHEDPVLAAEAALQMAKIAVVLGRPDQAKKMLVCAFNLDEKNVGIWFELAMVELVLGDHSAVRHYVKHILAMSKKSPEFYQYYVKLMSEPLLRPFI